MIHILKKPPICNPEENLKKVSKDEERLKSFKLHDSLMNTFDTDIRKVCKLLKKTRGDEIRNNEIPFIETLAGRYHGNNVLEGFCANTEILCNDDNDEKSERYDNELYSMFVKDNQIIFDITSSEEIKIPHMNLTQLKDIILKKLKLNKACNIFMLTVEHLRFCFPQHHSSAP